MHSLYYKNTYFDNVDLLMFSKNNLVFIIVLYLWY